MFHEAGIPMEDLFSDPLSTDREVLLWAKENSFVGEENVCQVAASYGEWNFMEWAVTNGFSLSESREKVLAAGGNIKKWLERICGTIKSFRAQPCLLVLLLDWSQYSC
jgi:hypothetical protein